MKIYRSHKAILKASGEAVKDVLGELAAKLAVKVDRIPQSEIDQELWGDESVEHLVCEAILEVVKDHPCAPAT